MTRYREAALYLMDLLEQDEEEEELIIPLFVLMILSAENGTVPPHPLDNDEIDIQQAHEYYNTDEPGWWNPLRMSPSDCLEAYRFSHEEILQLLCVLRFPNRFTNISSAHYQCSAIFAICLYLRLIASPVRYFDIKRDFGASMYEPASHSRCVPHTVWCERERITP